MTAYELEGLSRSVLPFPLLELNKDLHCSRRNKPWISSRTLIQIRTEILKCASATFSINYWVSKWWWFVIIPSSLLTIVCFPPKKLCSWFKAEREETSHYQTAFWFHSCLCMWETALSSLITSPATTQRVVTLKCPSEHCSTWARAAHSETGNGAGMKQYRACTTTLHPDGVF